MNRRRNLIVGLGVAVLAVVALFGYLIWSGYRNALSAAEVTTRDYAAILEARLDATLRRIDGDMRDLASRAPHAALNLEAVPQYAGQLNANLDLHKVEFPELGGMRIFDADGNLLYTSDRKTTSNANIADLAHFRAVRDAPADQLVVSDVLIGRTTGQVDVVFIRALRDGQGAFRGAITASLNFTYLEKLFAPLGTGTNGIVAIYRSDKFTRVMRWPRVDDQFNASLPPDSPTRAAMASGKQQATLSLPSAADGVARIYSYHRTERYPFFVSVGVSRDEVLATWRSQSLLALAFILVIIGLPFALLYQLLRGDTIRHQQAALIDNSNDAIISRNEELRILSWNAAAERMFGYRSTEAIGQHISIIFPPGREAEVARNRALLSQGHPVLDLATVRRTKSGSLVDVSLSQSPIRDESGTVVGTALSFRDISERRRLESLLQEKQRHMEALVAATPVGVFQADPDGLCTFVNKRWSEITGLSIELAMGTGWQQALHPEDRPRVFAEWGASVAEGRPFNLEYRFLRAEGEIVWVLGQSEKLVSATGETLGYIGAITNITERRRAEAAQTSLEAQLRESQKLEAIGTLAGGIAHDFNNIIATILGNADLARQDARTDPAGAIESIEEIHKAGTRARDLVHQILSFSRREPTQRRPTQLARVVEESARLLGTTLPARITLEVICEPDAPDILADANQIKQVLINLANNAMQATCGAPGHIAFRLDSLLPDAALVSAHPELQALHAKRPGRMVRLAVSDDGPGMDAAVMARIFEPFFTTKPVGEGTGLGLSVVHGIVRNHEGAIVVTSAPGRGATFTIYLPIAGVPMAPLPAATRSENTDPPSPLDGGPRVLFLDDDESLVSLVKRLLERRGFVVDAFGNQRDALDALRAAPAAYDLVLTDYNMPGMSGLDVARAVRGIRADLPVAVASGFIDETLRAQAEGAGVREIIFKASAVGEFCEVVSRLAQSVVSKGTSPKK